MVQRESDNSGLGSTHRMVRKRGGGGVGGSRTAGREATLATAFAGGVLCPLFPLDRQRNADGRRRKHARIEPGEPLPEPRESGMAPLLKKLMAEYSATGLPPAYAPLIADSDDEVSPDERPHHLSEDHSDEDEPA